MLLINTYLLTQALYSPPQRSDMPLLFSIKLLCSIFHCDPDGARTRDPNIKSVVLYQLSYEVNPVEVQRFER